MLDVTTYIDKRLTALANLPANRPRDTLTQALTKSAGFLKALAIKLAPRKGGFLRKSIGFTVAYPEAYIGPRGVPYAALRELGGTIVARTVKNLAIPLFETGTSNPAPWPRDRDDLYFAVSRAGNAILFERGTGVPMYVLKPSVTQKATPYLGPAADQGAPVVQKIMGDTVYDALVNP